MDDIRASYDTFDLAAPLTPEELVAAGALKWQAQLGAAASGAQPIPLQTIEDVNEGDASANVTSVEEYNERYVYWNRCQALVALTKFEEGWTAFCELVLAPFIMTLRSRDDAYDGADPNEVMRLRTRVRCAEEFERWIKVCMEQAATEPKPRLPKEDVA